MKIFDMHIHADKTLTNPDELIAKMEKAGIYGGCVFSDRPQRGFEGRGSTFDDRIEEALSWCRGYEDRLFPIVWIDPYEENIIENVHKAVDAGICGFKMMCTDYFIYEEKAIELLKEIAKLNKPVIFHTGILWTEKASSVYNRPLNWEGLLTIEGLRFSMGHCSWPWIDECVALYGEFMSTGTMRNTAEMFLDTTPGTPAIYREEMLYKFYNTGYDVGDNIMYGSDSTAHVYTELFVTDVLDRDKKILDKLGISKENREKMYYKNLLRFLGKTEVNIEHFRPEPDKPNLWNGENKEVYNIIEKYYNKLKFPKLFDKEFKKALNEVKISDAITIEEYDYTCDDGKRNLLSYLFMCEELKRRYDEKNIPEDIFYDTISDLVIWTSNWSDIKGSLYLGEIDWLSNHLKGVLFKLGRLQFRMGQADADIPERNLKKGENVMEIHIPEGGSLNPEECRKSIEMAKDFFAKYFPEFKYEKFTCHSWLMDDTLDELLPAESNMIKFKDMFDRFNPEEDDSILRYVFSWNTTRYNVKNRISESSLAKNVKKYVKEGKKFYSALGIMK